MTKWIQGACMNNTATMLARNVRLAIAATPKTTSRTASRDVDLCRNGEAFPNPAGASLDSAGAASIDSTAGNGCQTRTSGSQGASTGSKQTRAFNRDSLSGN